MRLFGRALLAIFVLLGCWQSSDASMDDYAPRNLSGEVI